MRGTSLTIALLVLSACDADGPPDDGGPVRDAGAVAVDAAVDAGDTPDDAGPPIGDAGDHDGGGHASPSYESIRNRDPLFRQHEGDSQAAIEALGFEHDDFTLGLSPPDNGPGPGGQGQFRVGCQYSHFAHDDPIVYPGQPGAAHLHMFWGNTRTHAGTVFEPPGSSNPASILESGGGTCQGFELNRSAYWIPAMLDRSADGPSIVVPDQIILYYKSHRPSEVHPLPPGVELLAGNVSPGGSAGETFTANTRLTWMCGVSGSTHSSQSRIPLDCNPGDSIIASIQFPQCLAVDGTGAPVLRSDDHLSHTAFVNNNDPCPASHPYRVPQITYLVYYPNGRDGAGAGVDQWRLSSDRGTPGGSLHGDWLGGWNQRTIQLWTDGCFDPSGTFGGPRNCSLGQTGQNGTGRGLRRVSRLNDYEGPNFLTDPWPEASAGGHTM